MWPYIHSSVTNFMLCCPLKKTEGVSGQQGISGHGPSFRSLGAVFANSAGKFEGRVCTRTYHNLEELLTDGMRGA